MMIPRFVYAVREGQKAEYVPLDARLGLPAGDNSYVLEEWQQRLCVKDSFGQSVEDLKAILGQGVSVRTAESMNRNMAEYAEDYRVAQPVPPAEEEGELLVVTADGKGVVMRRTLVEELREAMDTGSSTMPEPVVEIPRRPSPKTPVSKKARQRRAEEAVRKHRERLPAATVDADQEQKTRKGTKRMAYVGAVYTIDPFPRTAEDVLDEMARGTRSQERPRPQGNRVLVLGKTSDEFREGGLAPAADLAFAANTPFDGSVPLQYIQRQPAKDGSDFGTVPLADATGILGEGHIEHIVL
jgi:hypothetical protein